MMRNHSTLRRLGNARQHGVAVLTVLLVVAMGSALAYALASAQVMVMAQSRHVLVGDALRDLLLGGEVLARQMLREDYEEDKKVPYDLVMSSKNSSYLEDRGNKGGQPSAYS